jgi:signal transduction histidine kinase
LKFTPAGGRIEISLDRDGTSWRLSVSDTGPGLSPEVLERLWSGLQPGDYVTPRAPASLGVGLSIVRHLAELHGGSVEASSPGPGQGARFTVRLPVPALVSSSLGSTAPHPEEPTAPPAATRAPGKRQARQQPPRILPRA